ncbi:hypothetical protein ACWKSP_08425 [Micromonosporaceae bacterium Da 78-11]
MQHFAAGVVFAAAAGEVLPDLKRQGHLAAAIIGFVIGVAVLLGLQQLERRTEATRVAGGKAGLPVGLLAAVGVDLLIDGILVGLGATLGSRQGLILTIALTLEIGFLALAVTAELADTAGSKLRAALISSTLSLSLSLVVVVGALIAVLTLAHAPAYLLAAVLAAGIAALLFLVTEELITEAHEAATDTPLLTALFFAGFLALYALEGAGG